LQVQIEGWAYILITKFQVSNQLCGHYAQSDISAAAAQKTTFSDCAMYIY